MSTDAQGSMEETIEQTVESPEVESPQDVTEPEVTNEQAEAPEVDTELPEPEATEESQEEASAASEQDDWISDDVRALASSYGLEDTDLNGFDSEEGFLQACRLLDRTLTRGQKPEQSAEESSVETNDGSTEGEQAAEDDLTLDPSKYEGYDEETQRIVRVARHLQEENQAVHAKLASLTQEMQDGFDLLNQARQQELHDREFDQFHELMDGMDEGLFGGKSRFSGEADARRKEVWNAYQVIANSLPQGQEKAPAMGVLVKRAAMLAFGDEMLAAQRKNIYSSINEQGRGRRPLPTRNKVVGDAPTAQDPRNINDAAKEIVSDPEFAAVYDSYLEANGNAPN